MGKLYECDNCGLVYHDEPSGECEGCGVTPAFSRDEIGEI